MLKWLDKDPDEIDYRDIDWTLRLYNEAERLEYEAALADDPSLEQTPLEAVVPVDKITSSQFALPSGLVANSSTHTDTATRVWLADGVEGQTYSVVNQVVTAAGRELDQTIKIRIKTK